MMVAAGGARRGGSPRGIQRGNYVGRKGGNQHQKHYKANGFELNAKVSCLQAGRALPCWQVVRCMGWAFREATGVAWKQGGRVFI